MRNKLILLIILVLIAAGILYKFRKPAIPGSGDLKNYNVVVITVDTLRADHLPAYGYTKVRTPNIDRLASESVIFEDAVAHVPMTLPSHASIFTGLIPPSHGVRDNAGFILDPKVKTLAEILKAEGYETAAFVSAFVLDSQFGLDQGFDFYSDNFSLAEAQIESTDVFRSAEETQVEVDSWLEQTHSKPFFLWVHYFDPHDPYNSPEPYKTEYASSPYDGEIAYTDHILGRLLDRIDAVKDKTIVVLTGDHGESLGEHKEQTHSLFIYNATQHVPLMIRLPKGKPQRIPNVVSHVDLVPTILDWLEIQPEQPMQGKSLVQIIQGKEKLQRAAFSESTFAELHYGWSSLQSITTEDYKFISAPKVELYDRKNDPGELNNIASQQSKTAETLQKQLDQMIQSSFKNAAEAQKMDPETEEKLRALGYVGTIVQGTEQSRKIDPKDRIGLLEAVSRAHKALDMQNYRLVVETTSWILQQEPSMVDAQFMLATAYLHLNEYEKAKIEMMKTISLKPDHIQTLYNLGFFYQLQGNLDEAEHWYLQLLKYSPSHLRGTLNLVTLYKQKNDPDKANTFFAKIVDSYNGALKTTTSVEARSNLLEKLGQAYYATGDFQQAEKVFSEVVALSPKNFKALFSLGLLYRRLNRLEEATKNFQKVIEINDQFYPAYYQLAEAHLVSNSNLEEALRLVEKANSHVPDARGEELRIAIVKKLNASKN